MHPALFLDRDGVINKNRPDYVRSWAQMEIYPQALQALAALKDSPYKIIVITNQSGVGRGLFSLEVAQQINAQLIEEVAGANGRIDAAYLCPHKPNAGCPCRKPRPGMLLEAAQEHNLDLSRSVMIGDALTDLEAGQAAGVAETILLRTGRGRAQAALPAAAHLPLHLQDDLYTAVQYLLGKTPTPNLEELGD
ncbi:MAG: D-glycero-beta-D-manno-heptose 1,7-bisphosphate 7-phosphatase [Ardenticatenaceae bacterium]|nr:D-glycero-beta-D-manno-heptose 1,7-bisphosphate 7-phosphatase [Ardenticatenaceae bacterium]